MPSDVLNDKLAAVERFFDEFVEWLMNTSGGLRVSE